MGTRALVGHYTDDGAWRAVWVNYDASPEDLGADLVRAVRLYGGDPQPILDHLFSTRSWSGWPSTPNHPDDPDDAVFTPETVFYDFHYFYLFDVADRRLDVIEADPDHMTPLHQVRFLPSGGVDHDLGPSTLALDDLKPVRSFFARTCPAELTSALLSVLNELGLAAPDIGVSFQVRPWARHLHVADRRVHLSHRGGGGANFYLADDTARPFPDAFAWAQDHWTAWHAFASPLGFVLDYTQPAHMMWLKLFEELWERAEWG